MAFPGGKTHPADADVAVVACREQLGGAGQVGVQTDVYGLGIVLYRALTGQLPFREETLWGLRRQILTEQPQPPRALAPDVERLCLRCLPGRGRHR